MTMDFLWAMPYPELYKVCTLFQMTEIANPIKFHYKSLTAYLQDGPQCGLVALAICSGNANKETVEEIYEIAKNQQYTYKGEMFSVKNMADLANNVLPDSMSAEIYQGDLNDDKIRDFILDGGMILAPYDTEKDNSPGLHSGHKAHWAVLSGGVQTDEDFYVLARHGKVKNVAVWKLSKLAESNKQLFEITPNPEFVYKIPNGGIDGPLGLNSQAVLIHCS